MIRSGNLFQDLPPHPIVPVAWTNINMTWCQQELLVQTVLQVRA